MFFSVVFNLFWKATIYRYLTKLFEKVHAIKNGYKASSSSNNAMKLDLCIRLFELWIMYLFLDGCQYSRNKQLSMVLHCILWILCFVGSLEPLIIICQAILFLKNSTIKELRKIRKVTEKMF